MLDFACQCSEIVGTHDSNFSCSLPSLNCVFVDADALGICTQRHTLFDREARMVTTFERMEFALRIAENQLHVCLSIIEISDPRWHMREICETRSSNSIMTANNLKSFPDRSHNDRMAVVKSFVSQLQGNIIDD